MREGNVGSKDAKMITKRDRSIYNQGVFSQHFLELTWELLFLVLEVGI